MQEEEEEQHKETHSPMSSHPKIYVSFYHVSHTWLFLVSPNECTKSGGQIWHSSILHGLGPLVVSFFITLIFISLKPLQLKMKDCNKKSAWWCYWSSSVLKVVLIVIPLMVVYGVTSIVTPRGGSSSSSGGILVFYSPWVWSPTLGTSTTTIKTTRANSGGGGTLITSSEEGGVRHLDVDITSVHKKEEAHEALSHSLPLTFNESLEIKSLDDKKEEVAKSWMNNESNDDVVKRRRVHRSNTSLEKLEVGLARARTSIREAAQTRNQTPDDFYVPQGPMYWNANAFHRSYLEMEKQFKVFVYEEGEPPLFHNGPCKSIYSMEGNFIHEMEINSQFRTIDPEKAHVFFLPFSVAMMVQFIYASDSHDTKPLGHTVIDYVNVIANKYPFWNRSVGADHFMLSCHDWGPLVSSYIPHLYSNSIRVLCNANTSEGFNPAKDASFPEINLQTGETKGWIGGPSPSWRSILAFFAGGLHGPIRPILLNNWKNKDNDLRIYEYLPKGMSYYDMLRKSKFCICPSGYEVASPRIVEAIYTGCVPVLISDHYLPPFSDVLNWKSFSVIISPEEIPNLKRILMGISNSQYIRMHRRVLRVRRHFEVNATPQRYDVFHMILHSIWLRRLNVHISDELFQRATGLGT